MQENALIETLLDLEWQLNEAEIDYAEGFYRAKEYLAEKTRIQKAMAEAQAKLTSLAV